MKEQSGDHAPRRHEGPRRFDPDNWQRLVSDERRALIDPDRLLARLGVRAGATIADLGAGPGFFTIPLAALVGEAGRVYAVDVSPEMTAVLSRRLAERGGLPQVQVLEGGESTLPIPDRACDLALLAFVLHELPDAPRFLAEVRRILAPGGRLAVIEWVPRAEPMGPPLHERLSTAESEAILAEAGLHVLERGEVNPSNYYLIAQ